MLFPLKSYAKKSFTVRRNYFSIESYSTFSAKIFKVPPFRNVYFKVRNFRCQKLSRISPTAKLLYFAGINFRGRRINEGKIFFIIRTFSVSLYNSAKKVQEKSNN